MNPSMISFTVCITGLAYAGQIQRLPSGLEFLPPNGWQVNATDQGATLVPPGNEAKAEVYLAGIMTELRSLNDTSSLPGLVAKYLPAELQPRSSGQPIPFMAVGGRGLIYSYDARSGFTPLKVNLYLVDLQGRGVAALAAIGQRDRIANRNFELMAMATSFNANSSATAPAAQQQQMPAHTQSVAVSGGQSSQVNNWTQRLADKKLVQFSGYSSGGGSGGMSSERKLYLSSDGNYAFRSSSSVSIYVAGGNGGSSGQSSDSGRWRVVDQGGQAMLELVSRKGESEQIALSSKGTQTFLNGRRWYVIGINE